MLQIQDCQCSSPDTRSGSVIPASQTEKHSEILRLLPFNGDQERAHPRRILALASLASRRILRLCVLQRFSPQCPRNNRFSQQIGGVVRIAARSHTSGTAQAVQHRTPRTNVISAPRHSRIAHTQPLKSHHEDPAEFASQAQSQGIKHRKTNPEKPPHQPCTTPPPAPGSPCKSTENSEIDSSPATGMDKFSEPTGASVRQWLHSPSIAAI